jgi:hypothetical protein
VSITTDIIVSSTFEKIDNTTIRLKVPGGWFLKTVTNHNVHTLFIVDEAHRWQLEPDKKIKGVK